VVWCLEEVIPLRVLAIVGDLREGRVFDFWGSSGLRKNKMSRSQILLRERKRVLGNSIEKEGQNEREQK